jgi:hypothetical protein
VETGDLSNNYGMLVGFENEKIHAGMDKIQESGLKKSFFDAVRIGESSR